MAQNLNTTLSGQFLDQMRDNFFADSKNKLMQNALTASPLEKVALNHEVVANFNRSVSTKLDFYPVANQRQSGRCWLFAALNLLRFNMIKRMKVENFELSQTYLFYWDKIERANFFYTNIIRMADRDIDDRTVAHILRDPIGDGGQWNMLVALIDKYGIVPQWAMPDTVSAKCSRYMDAQLERHLRQGALRLRELIAGGADEQAVQELREELMNEVYRIVNMHLGTPPKDFVWSFNDEDNKYTRMGRMTPKEFADYYITNDLDNYVCLVNDPRNEYGKLYTVDCLGNVVGAPQVRYLNVPIEVLRDSAKSVLEAGVPVWFGCDTGKQCDRQLSVWDENLFEYDAVYGTKSIMDKTQRLLYQESLMTHAMLFVGVDANDDGSVNRWRVENSWGEDGHDDKGFYTMNQNWFDQYVFEVAVHKDRLSPELRKVVEENAEPIVLPAWDPMGALA